MIFNDLYRVLVISYKIVPHEYFLDDMTPMEVELATKYLKYVDSNGWEQTRHIMLAALRPHLKKKDITAQELFPLPIDKDVEDEPVKEITNADLEWWKNFKKNYKASKK